MAKKNLLDWEEDKKEGRVNAKDYKCIKCDERAVAFYPVFDPDIPYYPYCAKHLKETELSLLIKLTEEENPFNKK